MMRFAPALLIPLALSAAIVPAYARPAMQDCETENARDNRAWPLKTSADFVPLATDDSVGFYEVYSGRTTNGTNLANTVGIFIFELDGGEILIFGAGYGTSWASLYDANYDVTNVDAVLRGCLGREPASTPIRFISPHWHGDHINVEFIHEMEAFGYPVIEILFHEDDAPFINNYYDWTYTDRTKFTLLSDGACGEEIMSFMSPLGKIWFTARSGHAPGAIDAVIDVRGNPRDRFVILGSAPGGACPNPPPGTRQLIKSHGNAILRTDPQVVPYGCGINSDGSMGVLSGAPRIGSTLVLGVDNPAGDVAAGSIPYLWPAFTPDDLVPCGTPINLAGLTRPGELLLGGMNGSTLAPPLVGLPWAGPGNPCSFQIEIPYDQALVGCSLFYQGALIDPFGGAGARIVLTEAVELRIGQ